MSDYLPSLEAYKALGAERDAIAKERDAMRDVVEAAREVVTAKGYVHVDAQIDELQKALARLDGGSHDDAG